jgi:TP901 family phage tail tape measure protein
MAALEEELLNINRTTPATATEIAGVAEAAGALGVARDDISDFTRLMIGLGESTDLTADSAATNFAQIANIMQLPNSELERMGAALVDLGNNGASTESQIVDFAARLAGAANQTGMTASEMLALSSTLASVGINAEAGGTAMSRTMLDFQLAATTGESASGSLEQMAAVARTTADEFAGMTSTQQIEAFVKGLQAIEKDGGSVIQTLDDMGITEIRQRDALLRLVGAGDLLTDQLAIGNEAWEENIALQKEVDKRYGTTESKLKIMRNNFNDVLRILGEKFIPVLADMAEGLVPVAEWLGGLVDKFMALPGPVKAAIGIFVGVLAVLGPVLLIGSQVVAVISALAAVVGVLVSPVALVIVGIAALAAGLWWAYQNVGWFRDAINGLADWFMEKVWPVIVESGRLMQEIGTLIAEAVGKIFDIVRTNWESRSKIITVVFDGIKGYVETVWELIVGFIEGWLTAARGIIQTITSLIKGDWEGVWEGIKMFVSGVWEMIKSIVSAAVGFVRTSISTALSAISTAWGLVWGGIKDAVRDVWEGIKDYVRLGVDALVGFITGLPGRVARGIGSGFNALWENFKDVINRIIDGINSIKLPGVTIGGWDPPGPGPTIPSFTTPTIDPFPHIPRFHSGGDVPGGPGDEMLAVLQGGERVQSRAELAAMDGPIVLIIEGKPFTAMLADHDRAQVGALMAGVR